MQEKQNNLIKLYNVDDLYEFHIGISTNNEYEYDYITLRASYMGFE